MKRLLFLLLLATPAFGQAIPINIPIQNASFEAPVTFNGTDKCGRGEWGPIPGWQATQRPGGTFGVIDWTCGQVPDGVAVAFIDAATISQDLGFEPQAGIYVLKFWVANWFYTYPGHYDGSLTIGGLPVCHTSSYPLGDFSEITLTCPIPGHITLDHWLFPEGNLGVSLTSIDWWPLLPDNVSLTFTPTN